MTKYNDYDLLTDIEDKEAVYKGWNLSKDKIIEDLESYFGEEINILEVFEGGFYTTRYYDGSDAKEHNHDHWVLFMKKENMKKTHGKCTHVKFSFN